MSEFKPCPFCGSEVKPKVFAFNGEPNVPGYVIRCDASGFDGMPEKGCGAESGWGDTPEEAAEAWNRRAARSTVPEAGKAVAKELEWEAREKPDLNGNRYWRAQTTFDWGYRIYFEDSRYVFQQRGIDFATLDEAKAAAQADYEARILSALTASEAEATSLRTALAAALSTEPGEADPFEHCAKEAEAQAELVEQMRGVYPGDPTGALGRDANKMRRLAKSIRLLRPAAPLPEDTHHGR